MEPDVLAMVISIVATIIAIVSAVHARQQAHAAQDSAASAVRSADATSEQAVAAREQVTLGQRQLEHAEKVRKEQSDPYVIVDIRPSSFARGFLMLVIENIGTTIARNVRFEFTPPLRSARKLSQGPISEAPIIRDGISTLPPGRRIEMLFDFAPERAKSELEEVYSVTVYADGPNDAVGPLSYKMNIGELFGWHPIWDKTLHDGVQTLEKIEDILGKTQSNIQALMRRRGGGEQD